MGEGAQPWEYTLGASPSPQSQGDESYFHFRFLESPWAFWHLESDPPHFLPHEKRVGGRTWHWPWVELWLHRIAGHSQKGGVSPGQAPIWDRILKGIRDSQWSSHWVVGGVC